MSRVELAIFKDSMQIIQSVYPTIPWFNSWERLLQYVDQCQQYLKITLVRWNRPPSGIYKLNTDGSAIHNTGQTGGGGILRDDQGKLIYAFSIPLAFGTNNFAEIQAALYGLNWCQQHGFKRLILEVDSELLVKWINNTQYIPWRSQQDIQQLQDISKNMEYFQCQHIYREANATADLLAKGSHKMDIIQHFYTPQQLRGAIKGNYILDKMGMQLFRRRKIKRIKHPP